MSFNEVCQRVYDRYEYAGDRELLQAIAYASYADNIVYSLNKEE